MWFLTSDGDDMRGEKISSEELEFYMKQYADIETGVLMDMSDKLRAECYRAEHRRDELLNKANGIEMVIKGRMAVGDIFDAVVSERLRIQTESQDKDLDP
jgi:hypothetical protein